MKRIIFVLAVFVCLPAAAAAQTEGKISVGASVSRIFPADDDLKPVTGFGPLVRLNPRKGWGVAGAFNWFRADLDDPSGASGDFATLRVRPLMAGVAYTIGPPKVLTSFSIVAGPSWNKIEFEDDFLDRVGRSPAPAVDIETSFAVRPGVNVTWSVAPRVGIVFFGGYVFNRPDVVYTDTSGTEFRNRWKADAAVLSVGAVYSLF